MLPIENLPESWLHDFVQSLPQHLKLKLRCCSKQLQRLVDAPTGVGLMLSGSCHAPTALQLCAGHLTRLHTLQLAGSTPPSAAAQTSTTQSSSIYQSYAPELSHQLAVADCIRQLPRGLPALKKLTVSALQQPDILAAVLQSRPTALTQVKLFDRATGDEEEELLPDDIKQHCSVLLQLPGAAPSLACLEADHRTYRLAAHQLHLLLLQPLPHLRSLILHPKLSGVHAASCWPLIPSDVWSTVIQPLLTGLTCLHIGQRAAAEGMPDSIVLDPAVAGAVAAIAAAAAAEAEAEAGAAVPAGASRDPAAAAAAEVSTAGEATTAAAAAAGCGGLSHLLQLKCSGLDGPIDDTWTLSWVSSCVRLTTLEIRLCSAGELDCDALAQLQQLQSLSLHYFDDEFVSTAQLAPLAACTQLTQLQLQALLVEVPCVVPAAAAAVDEGGGGGDVLGRGVGGEAAHANNSPAATPGADSSQPGSAGGQHVPAWQQCDGLPQLASLRRLTAGVMGMGPLTCWTPQLTWLKDLDYDLFSLELDCNVPHPDDQPGRAALAGLSDLQVLSANIFALARHAATPHNLLGLLELHVDMVGSMEGTCLEPHGLPHLPHLTKLVMSIDTKVHRNLSKTYSTHEDRLLWRNQSAVRHLRLRGSSLLGGFLIEQELLQQLPSCLPALQRVDIVRAQDLTLQQLQRFVGARVCRHVLVQGCRAIEDRDCVRLQGAAGVGQVAVEYGM